MSSRVRRGFVLLEAAVALLVIGICAAAALELSAAQLRAAGREQTLTTAAALAQHRLAAVRLLEPVQLRRLPDSLARGRFAPPFSHFGWRAAAATSVEQDLYDLRVEISWPGGALAIATRQVAPLTPSRQGVSP